MSVISTSNFSSTLWRDFTDALYVIDRCNVYRVEGEFCAYEIACFVIENKIALPHDQAQAQVTPPLSLTFDDPINKLSRHVSF